MEEKWRDIEGYEKMYQVSNFGRVRTLNYKRTQQIRILSQTKKVIIAKDGTKNIYFIIGLYKNGHGVHRSVHRLVAAAFPEICGECKNGYDVHHLDHNTQNNNATNLKCLSKQQHSIIHNHGNRLPHGIKWTENQKKNFVKSRQKHIIQMDLNGREIMGWFSATDCEKDTGMKKAAISRCCSGKQSTSYGYKWRYAS